jgi:hypothetical protein
MPPQLSQGQECLPPQAFDPNYKSDKPQSCYDEIKRKFAEERDLRLNYRSEGTAQYTSDLDGDLPPPAETNRCYPWLS